MFPPELLLCASISPLELSLLFRLIAPALGPRRLEVGKLAVSLPAPLLPADGIVFGQAASVSESKISPADVRRFSSAGERPWVGSWVESMGWSCSALVSSLGVPCWWCITEFWVIYSNSSLLKTTNGVRSGWRLELVLGDWSDESRLLYMRKVAMRDDWNMYWRERKKKGRGVTVFDHLRFIVSNFQRAFKHPLTQMTK